MQEWIGLAEFVSVVNNGSMSKAADELGITKSSVSKRIAQLEHRLQIQLLHREANGVNPTREGDGLFKKSLPILEQLNEINRVLLSKNSDYEDEIRVSLPLGVGENLLQPIFSAFQISYPSVRVLLHYSTRQVDIVNEGYDLCFRLSNSPKESEVAKKLWQRPLHLCASSGFIRKYNAPDHPEQLAQLPCLAYCEDIKNPVKEWSFKNSLTGEEVSVTPKIVMGSDSVDSLVRSCAQEVGILYCSEFFIHERLQAGCLFPVLTDWVNGTNTLWLAFPTAKSLSKIARLFVDFTEGYFREHYQ
ncbi:MAG: LysR family transcriptional regulator [Pseudomonadota bacterium]